MEEQTLLNLLRDSLSLEIEEHFGYYGEHSLQFKLKLDGETISSDIIYLPKACNCNCGDGY